MLPGRHLSRIFLSIGLSGLILLGAVLAFLQAPDPDVLGRSQQSDFAAALDRFLRPVEHNAFLRLPTVEIGQIGDLAMTPDGDHAWMVGDHGVILASDDRGSHWHPQQSGNEVQLYDIDMRDGRCGWIVGEAGTILKTEDGGDLWQAQESGTKQRLTRVVMLEDCRRGWITGLKETWLTTVDGGLHWRPARGYMPLSEAPEKEATIRLRVTRQAGESWSAFAEALSAADVAVARSGNRAWAIGHRGAVGRTEDGGRTWQGTAILPRETFDPRIVMAEDLTHGIVVDARGEMRYTADGGDTWAPAVNPLASTLSAVSISADGGFALAVGDHGTVLASEDGGRSWMPRSRGRGDVTDLALQPGTGNAWAIIGSALFKSEDRGRTWQPQPVPGLDFDLRMIAIGADGRRFWIAGRRGLLRSEDGGITWSAPAPPRTDFNADLAMLPDGRGWAVGGASDGWIVSTRDHGATWSEPLRRARLGLEAVAASPDGAWILAVGRGPKIMSSRDGGASWEETELLLSERDWLRDVAIAPDGRHAVAVGNRGALVTTADGGTNWAVTTAGHGVALNVIAMRADGGGWIGGLAETLISFPSTDGTWQPLPAPFKSDVQALAMQSDGFGLAGGAGFQLARSEDSGRSWETPRYARSPAQWFYAWLALGTALECWLWRPRRGD